MINIKVVKGSALNFSLDHIILVGIAYTIKKRCIVINIYIVKENDSVDSISNQFNIAPEMIIYSNQISYPYPLAVGQALLIPTGAFSGYTPDILTNGYAYTFIDLNVLNQTLPYLSSLSIFSYGFTTQGELIAPIVDDTPLIEAAKCFGTRPILTLTPLGPEGTFNSNLITVLVHDVSVQAALIDELTEVIIQKGYEGVDIDFEYILADDRIAFVNFVWNIRTAINRLGYPVSVALAPKTSDTQTGLLYEGKDYRLLGEAANSVLLMTYEWGYTYGPPMAVAPLNKVREVVEYAVSRIPANKIDLGIPNYGYDWTLPFVKGESKARTIGNLEAVQIAIDNGVEIQFDNIAMSPYFNYIQDGIEHEVWFEDVRSLYAKFNLVKEFELRGVGYWQIMRLFRANWLLLADLFNIQRDR